MRFSTINFIRQCENSLAERDPLEAIKRIMDAAVADQTSIIDALPPNGAEEILLHHTASITIYRVLVYHGLEYPPHEHGMPVIIGLYSGCETNFLYRRRADNPSLIEKMGRVDITPPNVVAFNSDVIHSVTNLAIEPSAALHVYVGDLSAQRRSLWTLDLEGELTFSEKSYFARARRRAAERALI
jgi:predicted metal-dependent enzyme (double-stranded beta helix superfamily)